MQRLKSTHVIRSDFPYLADWFAISTRWAGLLLFSWQLASARAYDLPIILALALTAAWNVFMTILALRNTRLPLHRLLSVAVDLIAALVIFYFSGGFQGPLVWAGVLPLLSAGMYYEWRGGVLTGSLLAVCQLVLGLVATGSVQWQSFGLAIGWNLALGLVLGALGGRIIIQLRSAYHAQVNRRRQAELEAQREEGNRLRAFYRMIETLSATLNYQVVLDTILDLSATLLGESESERLISAVLLYNSTPEMQVNVAWGLSPSDKQISFPGRQGVLEEVLHSASRSVVLHPTQDPELGRISSMADCSSLLCLPLVRGMDVFGVLIYAHPDIAFFTEDRIELLEMVSHQAVIAIQNARLYKDLAQEKERLVEIEDEARKRLARELHDGPVQSVAGISMRLAIARRMLAKNSTNTDSELAEIESLARRTVEEIRHMLFTLRPLVLESHGLIPALQTMAEKMQDVYQQPVQLDTDAAVVEQMDTARQTIIFYLAEEAVNNARKHAEASEIQVRLGELPGQRGFALLEVEDNGHGFDINEVLSSYERRGSLGLISLQERTDMIGGVLKILSKPGEGTRVRVIIPLDAAAAERIQRGLLSLGN